MKYIICFYFFFTACAAPKATQNPPKIQVDTIDGRAEITIPTLPGGGPFILSTPVTPDQGSLLPLRWVKPRFDDTLIPKPACKHIWAECFIDTVVQNLPYPKQLYCVRCLEQKQQVVYKTWLYVPDSVIQKHRQRNLLPQKKKP